MHPTRGADFPDYKTEEKSLYEIWWTLGWPYETACAMSRMTFAGFLRSLAQSQDRHPSSGRNGPVF